MSRRASSAGPEVVAAAINGLTAQGLGIATVDDRTLHIRNALPGETVQARIVRRRKGKLFADGVAVVEHPHADRTASACVYFPRCGGCSMHHLRVDAQLRLKQELLSTALAEHGIRPRSVRAPVSAGRLGYRRKARLGVRQVGGQVLVGFRESFSNRVARMESCMVLSAELSRLLLPLRRLIGQLSIADKIPQIEVAQGDEQCVLMVRHLEPFSSEDLKLWQDMEVLFGVRILLQSGGYDTLRPLAGSTVDTLGYQIPDYGLYMRFLPQQFTQINLPMNVLLIRHVMAYLGDLGQKKVADLFCGIGNFSLPLARAGAAVWGYEGAPDAVDMARQNARLNGLGHRVQFTLSDLYGENSNEVIGGPNSVGMGVDVLLMDPPRSGAGPNLPGWLAEFSGDEIIYVSCNPDSFAADAVHIATAGFELSTVGIFDMFPHTAHVETMGYFRRQERRYCG